jgi:hypothetical protein
MIDLRARQSSGVECAILSREQENDAIHSMCGVPVDGPRRYRQWRMSWLYPVALNRSRREKHLAVYRLASHSPSVLGKESRSIPAPSFAGIIAKLHTDGPLANT